MRMRTRRGRRAGVDMLESGSSASRLGSLLVTGVCEFQDVDGSWSRVIPTRFGRHDGCAASLCSGGRCDTHLPPFLKMFSCRRHHTTS